MNKGEPVNIRKVGNGFIVNPEVGQNMAISDHNTMVFNDITQMNDWLVGYFEDPELNRAKETA
jgi:hypothetical protein